jgi:hypothetical protein
MVSAETERLSSEFEKVAARAEQMLAGLNKRVNENLRPPLNLSLLAVLTMKQELRNYLEAGERSVRRLRELQLSADEERQSRDAFLIRKSTLAIQLRLTRLAELLLLL